MAAIFQPYHGGQTTEDTAEDVQDEAPAFDVDVSAWPRQPTLTRSGTTSAVMAPV